MHVVLLPRARGSTVGAFYTELLHGPPSARARINPTQIVRRSRPRASFRARGSTVSLAGSPRRAQPPSARARINPTHMAKPSRNPGLLPRARINPGRKGRQGRPAAPFPHARGSTQKRVELGEDVLPPSARARINPLPPPSGTDGRPPFRARADQPRDRTGGVVMSRPLLARARINPVIVRPVGRSCAPFRARADQPPDKRDSIVTGNPLPARAGSTAVPADVGLGNPPSARADQPCGGTPAAQLLKDDPLPRARGSTPVRRAPA